MKRIISILLFFIICISHVPVIDAVLNLSDRFSDVTVLPCKACLPDEEPESEKENSGKEEAEGQEKYYSKHNYTLISRFQLSDKDKFICFNTKLNLHPFHEDDIEPPRPVIL